MAKYFESKVHTVTKLLENKRKRKCQKSIYMEMYENKRE